MKEAHVYLGHSIDLSLTRNHDSFRFTYFIDTQYCFEGTATSLDANCARNSALASAYRSIALLDSIAPSTLVPASPQLLASR